MNSLIKTQKEHSIQRLKKEIPELRALGWSDFHLDILKKHFGFYLGLMSGKIKPKENKYKQFIETIKNYKTSKPKNVHEEVYLNYLKFFMHKNSKNKNKPKQEDPIFKNIPMDLPGSKQYPASMQEKLNIEYDYGTWNDWFDDWKYR